MSTIEDPWVALKPPASDNITYLTFVEANLSLETLPRLREALQAEELTHAIGWDLVHLLLPLVPAAEQCLLDIARLGNPREVIIKVSESLRLLEMESLDEQEELETEEVITGADGQSVGAAPAVQTPTAVAPMDEAELPLPVLRFRVLLTMLSILQPRIKTKFPSRFLSTTLQAVLATYAEASMCHDEMTEDVIKLIKALTGVKRPVIPPRRSTSRVLLADLARESSEDRPKPVETTQEDSEMQRKLLQSFLTHILEDYMLSIPTIENVPGMAWSARFQEKHDASHVVPHKQTSSELAAKSETFQNRLRTVGSLLALAQDLSIKSHDLCKVLLDKEAELRGNEHAEVDPPTSPSDIPFSKTGSLMLICARKAAETFYDQPTITPPLSVFPEHSTIVKNFLGTSGRSAMGLEPEALIDAILFLGLLAIADNAIGEPESDEQFNEYLQNISLLSANSSSPLLRYEAHFLCTNVLRSHPNDLARLCFIRDTLEHCPYENLKTSAVSWIKGETIEANPPTAPPPDPATTPSIFATPVALSTLSPYLFPDVTEQLTAPSLTESYMQFQAELSFYLAALNFYYLLLKAKHLHEPIDVRGLTERSGIRRNYLEPLKGVSQRYSKALAEGGELFDGEITSKWMDLKILEDAITRVEEGIFDLNASP